MVFFIFHQSSYDELKVFPTTAILDEKQAKHLMNAKAGQDEKSFPMDELMVRIDNFFISWQAIRKSNLPFLLNSDFF